MLSFQPQQNSSSNVAQPMQTPTQPQQEHQNNVHHPHQQQPPQPQQPIQTMRLRDDPPVITPATSRPSRKRKSPPSNNNDQQAQAQAQPPAPPPPLQHVLPPPHAMMHPLQGPLATYTYTPTDYTPAGMPPNHPQPPGDVQPSQPQSPQGSNNGGRALSSSKRAEQNRKAQRAFRERRDQHVKALESRSQLLDAALASADEANRRWEECRALVDQLRVENAALRAALSQAQLLPPAGAHPTIVQQEEGKKGDETEVKSGEAAPEKTE